MNRPRRSPPPSIDVTASSSIPSSLPQIDLSSPASPPPLGFTDLRSRFEQLSTQGNTAAIPFAKPRVASYTSVSAASVLQDSQRNASPSPLPAEIGVQQPELPSSLPVASVHTSDLPHPQVGQKQYPDQPVGNVHGSGIDSRAAATVSQELPAQQRHHHPTLLHTVEAELSSIAHGVAHEIHHLRHQNDADGREVHLSMPVSREAPETTSLRAEEAHPVELGKARRPPPRPPNATKPNGSASEFPIMPQSGTLTSRVSMSALRSRFEAARVNVNEASPPPLPMSRAAHSNDGTPKVDARVPPPASAISHRSRQLSSGSRFGELPSGVAAALDWAEGSNTLSRLSVRSQSPLTTRSVSAGSASPLPNNGWDQGDVPTEENHPPRLGTPVPKTDEQKDANKATVSGAATTKQTSRNLPPLPAPLASQSQTRASSTSSVIVPTPRQIPLAPPSLPPAPLESKASGPPLLPPPASSTTTSSYRGVRDTFAPPPLRSASLMPSQSNSRANHDTPASSSDSCESDDESRISGASFVQRSSSTSKVAQSRIVSDGPLGNKPVLSTISSETLPDASRANRSPPSFDPPRYAQSKHFHCFAVWGHTIATASGDKVRIYRVGSTAKHSDGGDKLCSLAAEHGGKEVKVTSMAFRPSGSGELDGRYLWCGTREGSLCEMDITQATVQSSKHNLHTGPVVILQRIGNGMLSMDASGKICIWLPRAGQEDQGTLSLMQSPVAQRVTLEKSTVVLALDAQLWACSGSFFSHNSLARIQQGQGLASAASAKVAAVGFGTSPSKSTSPAASAASQKNGPKIKIFNPFSTTSPFHATSRPVGMGTYGGVSIGAITSGTIIPQWPDRVYLGHESGHISIWDRTKLTCIGVQRLSMLGFTAICGVDGFLWTGNRSGRITVYAPPPEGSIGAEVKVRQIPWKVLKSWPAHKGSVSAIVVDPAGLDSRYSDDGISTLSVVSAGVDHSVHIWDGLLSADWLAHRVSLRNNEFSTYRQLRSLHVTFNIDAASPSDLNASVESLDWLPRLLTSAMSPDGSRLPDIIYFGFQEIVDLEDKRLTAKSMLLNAASGKKAKSDMSERISHQYRQWYDRLVQSVRLTMPAETPYRVVHSESMVGLFSCVFVRSSEFDSVSDAAVEKVKTGLGGRWGNKGSIVSRFLMDDTSCCFINAHLAAGQRHVKQRNDDIAQIFEAESLPVGKSGEGVYVDGGSGELILDHELVFLGGDLNYRIDLPRSQVIKYITSGQLEPLLAKDQLHQELLRNSPVFRLRGFQEAARPTNFAPTYKFDPGTKEYDTSEKSRVPAWCDRLLFRSAGVQSHEGCIGDDWEDPTTIEGAAKDVSPGVQCLEYRSWPEVTISDHRPVSAIYEFQVKRIDWELREAVKEQERESAEQRRVRLVQRALDFYDRTGWKWAS